MTGLPEPAAYDRPMECPCCGYVIEGATDMGDMARVGPLGRNELPPGSLVLCLACGAWGMMLNVLVDDESREQIVRLPAFAFDRLWHDNEAFRNATMARTRLFSTVDDPRAEHPYRSAGAWVSRTTKGRRCPKCGGPIVSPDGFAICDLCGDLYE